MSLFQKSVINKYLKTLDSAVVEKSFLKFKEFYGNQARLENIRLLKEENYQRGFLRDIFVVVLGYTIIPDENYNLTTEFKNLTDAKKADGAIVTRGHDPLALKAIGVIELKSTKTTSLESITEQAFNYKNHQPNCRYIITSNFEKVRFYIDNATDFEEFNLFTLSEKDFKILYLILSKKSIFNEIPLKLKKESVLHEENISKQLYHDYSQFKRKIFENLVKNNPQFDKLTLFKKSQKLLDRFLFILFGEDSGLVPPNAVSKIIDQWKTLEELDEAVSLYSRFVKFFHHLDIGYKYKTFEVPAYNGGLFSEDKILNSVRIDDEILLNDSLKLSSYDFQTEIDVNILGHIFENSLNEIEELTAEFEGKAVDKKKTKRKKEGVYYTPKYITKYIVENTVGELCNQKKKELNLDKIDISIIQNSRTKQRKLNNKAVDLLKRLKTYSDYLLSLKILDPACGSGAFLNQALEFLLEEHQFVDEYRRQLEKDSLGLFDVKKSILENNLYGVDINEESVEIAKLSLWLRTAERGRKLSDLSNSIKCGNSLIDDPKVAGEKAFKWEEEFPKIMSTGGFDVVIGNPPYGILIDSEAQKHYSEFFPLTNYKINLYVLFIERMMQIFSRGIVHFIIPKSLLFNSFYKKIREHLINYVELNEIFTITEKIFEDAEVGGSLLLKFTIKDTINRNKSVVLASSDTTNKFITGIGIEKNLLIQSYFLSVPNFEISVVSSTSQSIIDKLHNFFPIKDKYILKNGLNPGNIKHILISENQETKNHKPIIWGKDISRYIIVWSGDYINYDASIGLKISLDDLQSKKGMNKQNRIDFALRKPELFENSKIVIRKTGDSLIACLDEEHYYFDTLLHGIYLKNSEYTLLYLLAILNSKPASLFYRLLHDIKGKVFAKISLDNLSSFPIPEGTTAVRNQLAELADFLLKRTKELSIVNLKFQKLISSEFGLLKISKKLYSWYELNWAEFLVEFKKQKVIFSLKQQNEWFDFFESKKLIALKLKMEIIRVDESINQIVYNLYGLTEEEIQIVENSFEKSN